MKIVPPKYDECIKNIFRNEEILKHFISDILAIPIEQIQSLHLLNPFLKKKYLNQKLGILDVLAEINGNAKINIEIHLKTVSHWDKRQIFYLSKLYTADLNAGEDYTQLERCVSISILDFNLIESKEYHNIYFLGNKQGNVFSDIFEIHILELGKELTGTEPADDWIRLLNAESEEDLDMIKTKNTGILEAIREIKVMNLRGRLRMHYEAYMKAVRDQRAIENHARETAIREGLEQGREQGLEQGLAQGLEQGEARVNLLVQLLIQNSRSDEISMAVTDKEYQKKLFEEFGV